MMKNKNPTTKLSLHLERCTGRPGRQSVILAIGFLSFARFGCRLAYTMFEARQELVAHVHKSVLSPSTKQSVHSTRAEASTVHCNDPSVVASGPTLGPAQQKELWLRCSRLRVLRNVGTQHKGLHANLLPCALRANHRLGTQIFKFSFVGRDASVCINSMRASRLVMSLALTRSPRSHRKNSKLKLFGYVSFFRNVYIKGEIEHLPMLMDLVWNSFFLR